MENRQNQMEEREVKILSKGEKKNLFNIKFIVKIKRSSLPSFFDKKHKKRMVEVKNRELISVDSLIERTKKNWAYTWLSSPSENKDVVVISYRLQQCDVSGVLSTVAAEQFLRKQLHAITTATTITRKFFTWSTIVLFFRIKSFLRIQRILVRLWKIDKIRIVGRFIYNDANWLQHSAKSHKYRRRYKIHDFVEIGKLLMFRCFIFSCRHKPLNVFSIEYSLCVHCAYYDEDDLKRYISHYKKNHEWQSFFWRTPLYEW